MGTTCHPHQVSAHARGARGPEKRSMALGKALTLSASASLPIPSFELSGAGPRQLPLPLPLALHTEAL